MAFRNRPRTPFSKEDRQKDYQLFTDFIGKMIISCDITLFDIVYLSYNATHLLRPIWSLWAWSYRTFGSTLTFYYVIKIFWDTGHMRSHQSSLYMIRNILAKFYVNWVIISADMGIRHFCLIPPPPKEGIRLSKTPALIGLTC